MFYLLAQLLEQHYPYKNAKQYMLELQQELAENGFDLELQQVSNEYDSNGYGEAFFTVHKDNSAEEPMQCAVEIRSWTEQVARIAGATPFYIGQIVSAKALQYKSGDQRALASYSTIGDVHGSGAMPTGLAALISRHFG